MHETLEDWIFNFKGATLLAEHLRMNLEVMTNLTPAEIEELMRLNMIMVRQFAEDL